MTVERETMKFYSSRLHLSWQAYVASRAIITRYPPEAIEIAHLFWMPMEIGWNMLIAVSRLDDS